MPPTVSISLFGRARFLTLVCAAILCAGWAGQALAQTDKGVTLVKADLIADTTAVTAGKAFTVGLRLKMAPHWHTYWQYSGDAGLPTTIAWQLPDGFVAGPIQWPVPDKIVSPGDIINYGYGDEVVLLTEITPPATLPAGGQLTFKAKATWLVCAEKCIPGEAELSLNIPAGGQAQSANAEAIDKYRALLPAQADPAKVRTRIDGKKLTFQFDGSGAVPADGSEFFPLPGDTAVIDHPEPVTFSQKDGGWTATSGVTVTSDARDAEQVGGVWLFVDKNGKKSAFTVPPQKSVPATGKQNADGAAPSPAAAVAANGGSNTTQPLGAGDGTDDAPAGSVWHFLLLGFIGGLILNVMPCVLPVISLKLFSFVKQANESPAYVLRLGLAYAAGVFAWFLGFATLVVVLRAAGHRVGYAFHLQNPWFLVGLSAATFVFALNLLGVFEIILPGNVTNAASEASGSRGGYVGAFIQGLLATVLGSSCVAPFFGEALAFAFSQSAVVILAMFACIAAGMSAPFVLLAARPGWLKFLPKPGAWMERVKQGTGFLLLATVLWLLLTLGHSKGPDGIVWTGALLLVLGIACWVQGAFNTLADSDRTRWAARTSIFLLVLGGGWFCVREVSQARPPEVIGASFATRLDSALKTGRTVFVDFTADWCVSCKVNERVVLDSEPVSRAMREGNVMLVKADYTVPSDDISKLLEHFHSASVPLYVVYPAGRPDSPVVLPPLLTQQTVLDALTAATPHDGSGKPLAAR